MSEVKVAVSSVRACIAILMMQVAGCAPGDTTEPREQGNTVTVAWRTPAAVGNTGREDLAIDDHAFYTLIDGVSAFDLNTGSLLWSAPRPAGRPLNLVVSSGRVFVPSSEVVALDTRTGAELWRVRPDSFGRVEAAVDNKALYIGTDSRRVIAYDVATGRMLWSEPVLDDGEFKESVTGIIAHGDTVYAAVIEELNQSGGRKRGWMVALERNTGRVLWKYVNERPNEPHDVGRHAVSGRMLLMNDLNGGAMIGLDRFTGREVWRRIGPLDRLGAWDTFKIVDGIAYVASNDTFLYALDPETGRIIWQTGVNASASSSAVCGDKVFAGARGLHMANKADGRILAKLFFDEQGLLGSRFILSRLHTWGNRVYFVATDGVYAVSCDLP